jgi:hypothetical protein
MIPTGKPLSQKESLSIKHAPAGCGGYSSCERECVLFIGTQFSNLYTAVDTLAMDRVVVCLLSVSLVFVCKYVLGHSRVSQPLNLRLRLLWHLGFLTSPYASPTCRRRRLNSYRLLRHSTRQLQSQIDQPPRGGWVGCGGKGWPKELVGI